MRIAWEEGERRALLSDENGNVLFDTEEAWHELGKIPAKMRLRGGCLNFVGSGNGRRNLFHPQDRTRVCVRATPEDQLLWTKDESDYCWYSHVLNCRTPGKHELRLPFCGDFLRIFVNGRPVAQTAPPMKECRGPTNDARGGAPGNVNQLERSEPEYCQHFQVSLQAGRNRIDILCCALGLIKG